VQVQAGKARGPGLFTKAPQRRRRWFEPAQALEQGIDFIDGEKRLILLKP